MKKINFGRKNLKNWSASTQNPAGLLATRELSTPLQIAAQSSTPETHFEQTSSLASARHRSSQNPESLAMTGRLFIVRKISAL